MDKNYVVRCGDEMVVSGYTSNMTEIDLWRAKNTSDITEDSVLFFQSVDTAKKVADKINGTVVEVVVVLKEVKK